MDVRCAMKSRANGDLKRLIENAAQLRGRQDVTAEAERSDALGHIAMAVDLVTAHLVKPSPQPLGQTDFMRVDLVDAAFLHVVDSRTEAGDAEHVGRTAFEEIGELAGLRFARRIATGAAFAPGADLRTRADIQRAGAGRAEQGFVSRKRQ